MPQLEAWLQARGHDVVVTNAGVSGDTTAGGAARVAWTLTPDIDAMIVTLGGNDLLRGIDPAESRKNLEKILSAAKEASVEVLLAGLSAPGNFGPAYKNDFDAIYPELSSDYGTLLVRDFFAGLVAARDAGATTTDLMQADGIHPNDKGEKLIVEALGPKVEELIRKSERATQG